MGTKAPWHVWVVGIVSLLWDGSGAYTIVAAQHQAITLKPDEAAYYAAQAGWFVILVNLGLATALLGGLGLMLRKRWAAWAFAISLAAILFGDAYDLAMGTSRVYANNAAAFVTALIAVLAALQLWYAAAMAKRGVLG
jgi:hypothetical protein